MNIDGQQLSDSSGDNDEKDGGDKANDKIDEDRSTSATRQRRKVSMDLFLSSPADTEEDTGKSKGKRFATGLLRRAGLTTDEKLLCGKLNSARRKECKICGASKPKRDADKRRSKSRRSKSRRRHRSKSKSRKKSRAKRGESGDDTDSNGSKSDEEYNDFKQAATAIATTGGAATTTATAQAAAADSSGDTASNSEKKGVDSKQVAGKDADNSTGTSTTAASSPQSSSKTNDEEEQKQLLDKEDGVQMTSRVDRRSAMRGSRVRRSMMALFDSTEGIVVLTPATLNPISSQPFDKRREVLPSMWHFPQRSSSLFSSFFWWLSLTLHRFLMYLYGNLSSPSATNLLKVSLKLPSTSWRFISSSRKALSSQCIL